MPRLLSLDTHWSSDEARWLRRSANFMSAVSQGRFSEVPACYGSTRNISSQINTDLIKNLLKIRVIREIRVNPRFRQ